MSEHVHKMTRLHVGPPKTFYCETPGCDYQIPADQVARIEGGGTRVIMKDAPALVTTTVAAAAGEVLPTPEKVPYVVEVGPRPPVRCPSCGWEASEEQIREGVAVRTKGARRGRRKRNPGTGLLEESAAGSAG